MRTYLTISLLSALAGAAWAQEVKVANNSFEDGAGQAVPGWTLEGGNEGGLDASTAAQGKKSLCIAGDGKTTGAWRSEPLDFKPGALYAITFAARSAGSSGGTPVSGPDFCNIDLGKLGGTWKACENYFVTPRRIDPGQGRLRFGQWEVKGKTLFDDVHVYAAQAVYERQGDLTLGDGERLDGNQYHFYAPLGDKGRNSSRPLHDHQCFFNSNRWCLSNGSQVVYRHAIGGRKQLAGEVELGVGYYTGGQIIVEASTDGKAWTELGRLDGPKSKKLAISPSLLPAAEIWIRLRGQPKDGKGCSMQIGDYGYTASVDGPAATMVGRTHFFRVLKADPKASVRIESIGAALPGAKNVVVVTGDTPGYLGVTVKRAGKPLSEEMEGLTNGRSEAYDIPAAGGWTVLVRCGEFQAVTTISVPEFYDASYGQALPGSSDAVGLWWASSGWKINQVRPVPKEKSDAVVIKTARNEAEAAQVVLRPSRPLKGLTAKPSALAGPGGATLPASCVEVLAVTYLNVARPTDSTGVVAAWPDPLPALDKPIDVGANLNQPLWIRVKAPADAKAGVYEGKIDLSAEGWSASAPLRVEVFNFTLPDRMTCQSSFGFAPGTVWKYQNVTDEVQRREVLAKYLASFAAHHISPYDPAPMDHFRVHWPKATSLWQGGKLDCGEKHGGQASLLVVDDNPKAALSASYDQKIAIPPGGLRLRVWHKAQAGHKFLIAINHHDAKGQWMPGRNNSIPVEGAGEWKEFDRTITQFPPGAKFVTLSLWPASWSEDGSATGKVWFDDVSLQEAGPAGGAGGKELLAGGDFEPPPLDTLQPRIEWDAWDAAMRVAMDQYHFNSFMVPVQGMGGGTFHERYEPSLLGYAENTPQYQALFGSYCRQVQEHLRQKGWLDRGYIYWFDEPDPKDYEFVTKGFARLKAVCPDIQRMLTEQVEDALVGGPNIWCPLTPEFNPERAEKRRAAGERFWWYVCCGPRAPYCTLFLDHPGVEMRVWLWQTWQRKIDGILVWETVYWHSPTAYPGKDLQNPYQDPMSWCSGYGIPIGTKSVWGNGDGRFLYPPLAAAGGRPAAPVLEGPVESIRWEMLRDGIEDYEYLVMLRGLIEQKKGKLPAGELAAMRALLEVPAAITTDLTHFTREPGPIEARREQVARAIGRLQTEY